ncbi:Zinc finger protein [Plecturocebus cupreus]
MDPPQWPPPSMHFQSIPALETPASSHFVTQAGVQWHDLGSLHLLGSSDSPASGSQVAGIIDVHHHIWLISVFLVEAVCLTVLARLISNSWPQEIYHLDFPKCWDYRHEPLCLA